MGKVSITDNMRIFDKYWQSKIVGEFNGMNVKLVKLKGEFEWHNHNTKDELLMVLKGALTIEMQDEESVLKDGDLYIVNHGTDHRLIADEEAHLFVVEPKSTRKTETVRTKTESGGV